MYQFVIHNAKSPVKEDACSSEHTGISVKMPNCLLLVLMREEDGVDPGGWGRAGVGGGRGKQDRSPKGLRCLSDHWFPLPPREPPALSLPSLFCCVAPESSGMSLPFPGIGLRARAGPGTCVQAPRCPPGVERVSSGRLKSA